MGRGCSLHTAGFTGTGSPVTRTTALRAQDERAMLGTVSQNAPKPAATPQRIAQKRALARARKARQRDRARAAGLCIKNPAHGPVPGSTCKACQDAANVALTARRKVKAAKKRRALTTASTSDLKP